MVAEDYPHLHQTGIHHLIIHFHTDIAIGVFEVAIGRDCPNIHPFTEITMPQKSSMIFVAIPLNNRFFEFATNPTDRSYACAFADLPTDDTRFITNISRSLD